jgi:RNA polymerase sigma factor (sigma-70 family)
MAKGQIGPVLRHLRQLTGGPSADEPDAELLRRYSAQRDEEAFAALVRRHGALVLGVCRSVLGHEHDAEDAFQATFLVLARRARSIRKGDSVGSWLYGVAYRTALRAKRTMARRSKHHRELEARHPEQPATEAALRELQTVLHEEVARLPERYRAPFVLCCLEGKSRAEAAAELGWQEGTVSCRVARGREQLRGRLAARGVALAAALAAGSLIRPPASAAVPARLSAAAAQAAVAFEAGRTGAVSQPVVDLARGVLRGLAVNRARVVLALLLALGVVTFGVGLGAYSALPGEPPRPDPPPAAAPDPAAARPDVPGDPLPPGAVRRFGDDRFRHPGHVVASAVSPDGKRLATVSHELLQIADVETGRPLRRIPLNVTGMFATPGLAFSPDGRYLACVLNDQRTEVWDVQTGQPVVRLLDRKTGRNLCQFTPDGRLVLPERERTRLLEIPSGKDVGTWPVGGMTCLSADGKTFARVEQERVTVVGGEAETGKETFRLDVSTACDGVENGLAFSPDGRKLAVVHGRKEVQVWDVRGKARLASLRIEPEWIEQNDVYYTVAFSGDGSEVLFGTKQGAIHRWSVADGSELPWLHLPWGWFVRGMHDLPDGRTLLATEGSGRVVRWDLTRDQPVGSAPGCRPPIRIGLTPDGAGLVVGDWAGRIDLWETGTGRLLRTLQPGHDLGEALTRLAVSPDGRYIAVGEGLGRVRLLRFADGKEERTFPSKRKGGGVEVRWLYFTPDGRRLVVGDYGSAARVLDVKTGEEVWAADDAAAAAVSPDGRLLAFARNQEVTVADAATGAVVRRQPVGPPGRGGSFDAVRALAFSPRDGGLACALYDGRIVLFDAGGRERARVRATDPQPVFDWRSPRLDQPLTSLAFSPDGHWLLAGAADRSVRVWEAATGTQVRRFDGHLGQVTQVAFIPDGRFAVSAGDDGYTCLWDLRPAAAGADATAESLWRDAAAGDAAKGSRAAWALVATSDSRRQFLRERLKPAAVDADPGRVKRWIADLGDERFAVREAASRELAARARQAEPFLRQALQTPRDTEAKRRLEAVLAELEGGPTPDQLRALRLVHAAELAGTPAALSLLEWWAGGTPREVLTESARAALVRLERPRPASQPDR